MRPTLIILSISLWASCLGQIDWSIKEESKGKVKTIKTTSFRHFGAESTYYSGDSVVDYNRTDTKIILFNKDKRPIKHLWYTNKTDTVGYCLWEYDLSGRVVKQNDYRNSNTFERTIKYEYPSDSQTVKYLIDKNGLYSTWKKNIDSTNYSIMHFEIINGKIYDHYLIKMDSSFLPWKSYKIDSEGNWIQDLEQLYNERNSLVSYKFWTKDSSTYTHLEFEYDTYGDIVIVRKINRNGELTRTTEKQYDDFRNVIKTVTRYPSGYSNYKNFRYVYDDHGNWISKKTFTEYTSGVPYETSKIFREIHYYPD